MQDKAKKRAYQQHWIANRRQKYIDTYGPCVRCKSNENLEIDHIDPTQKSFSIRFSYNWKKLNPELAKCQILCSKCHLKKTLTERKPTKHGKIWNYQKGCRCTLCKNAKVIDNSKRKR